MVSEIIIDVAPGEKRIALLEDKELAEIYIERPFTQRIAGNIYRGKVSSVLPGMQAAFVDIGSDKNAFLYVSDVISYKDLSEEYGDICPEVKRCNIEDLLKAGQEITVQVVKEQTGTKGPRVTTNITLPGRYLVLLPNADYTGVSRRIENEEERVRLKEIVERIKPEGMGLIVRTAAEGMNEEDFYKDFEFLQKLWEIILKREKSGSVPRSLHKDLDLISRVLRDIFTSDISKLVINDSKVYEKILEFLDITSPELKKRVELFNKKCDLFDYYNIESKISAALLRKVWLKCGGYLIIDRTEALTVIDVNTGKYTGKDNLEETVVRANIEAAKEIAKQLRLRDIGGIIIIDFIDMHESDHQQLVLDTLKSALKKDRTRTTVIGMTGLGLIEMTRKKVNLELCRVLNSDCPFCDGTGRVLSTESIARNIEKRICQYSADTNAEGIKVEVHPEIKALLKGVDGENLVRMEKSYNKRIVMVESGTLKNEEVRITDIDTESLVC